MSKYILILLSLFAMSEIAVADIEQVDMEGQEAGLAMFEPKIYQGTKSVPGEFPMLGWIGNCTATAISRNVLYTASHCVSDGKRISYRHRQSGQSYAATCYQHPRYNRRTTFNDFALCKLDSELSEDSLLATILEETPAKGEKLLLNGYGAPNVTVHYWGEAEVCGFGSQDIVTCGRANLGGGDSGGPLFKWSDDRSGKSGFQLIGVNSRAGGGRSYFNRNSHDDFKTWVRTWSDARNVKICGIHMQCTGAKPEPEPEEPIEPGQCWHLIDELTWCIGQSTSACKEAYKTFGRCLQ